MTDVLDAFDAAIDKRKDRSLPPEKRDLRHHIAHLQVVQPRDVARFKELGVVANFQPLWSQKDKWMEIALQNLSEERSRWQYPIADMLESGAHVCFGSDWFVSSLNPLDGIGIVYIFLTFSVSHSLSLSLHAHFLFLSFSLSLSLSLVLERDIWCHAVVCAFCSHNSLPPAPSCVVAEVAVTHRPLGSVGEPFNPHQLINLDQALYAYTKGKPNTI